MSESYTERTSKIGFGPTRKLPRFDDRTPPDMRHMGRLAIVEPRAQPKFQFFKYVRYK